MAKKKSSLKPDFMASPEQLKKIQDIFNETIKPSPELAKGDWVFVNNEFLAEVTDRYQTLWDTSYKVYVIDTIAATRPMFYLITNKDTVIKVPANSKLNSLLVLYGKKK